MIKALFATVIILSCTILKSQTIGNTGKPIAEIFPDFHYRLSKSNTTGFNLNRAYFGYNYVASQNFSAIIKLEIGRPEDLPPDAVPKRYANYKEASITYTNNKLNITFGITSTQLNDYQQRFWGKRYVANTFQAFNGFGFISDLGVAVNYKFNDIFKADMTVMNGEGYSNIQLDNNLKSSLGITITPSEYLAIRLFSDFIRISGVNQNTIICFAGFKNNLINIGTEFNYKSNIDLKDGHDVWGLSGTGAITILKNTEFFVRCDYSTSASISGEEIPWNIGRNGTFFITGFQYAFTNNIKIALDYQGNHPKYTTNNPGNMIFINALFRF